MKLLLTVIFRVILFMIICPAAMYAQTSGKVIDGVTGNGIEGVVVTVSGTFLQTVTDRNGDFSFSADPDTTISLTHISYQPVILQLPADHTITLNRRMYISDEVTISATRAGEKSAIAYSNLDKSEIEKNNNGRDFPILLNSLPSVVVTSDAGTGTGYTGIRVRGSDGTRVNVTINGIPVNDAESHQVYWVDLPDIASSVENVQLQRGLGSSSSGPGAFGASINILTNKLSDKPYASIASSAGSFNTFKNTVAFGTGLLSNAFSVEGRLSKITSDGYIDRAASDLQSYYLNAGYYGNKNSLRFITFSGQEKTYQAWYGVPQDSLNTNRTYNPAGEYFDSNGNIRYYENQTDNYRQDYYQLLYSHEFSGRLMLNSALYYTHGEGYYEEYKTGSDLLNYDLSDTSFYTDLIRRLWLSNNLYGTNISADYKLSALKLTAGISANYYEGRHFGQVIASQFLPLNDYPHQYYNDWAYKTDASAFIKCSYNLTKDIEFSVDLQQRHIEYSYAGHNDAFGLIRKNNKLNFFNPKAGITYSPVKNIQFYLYGGIGHKEPVRDDYVNAAPGDTISPEKMVDLEAGAKLNAKSWTFGINLFHMYYDNQLILTGKINDVGEYIRQNVPSSFRTGIEAEGKYDFSKKLYVKANATYSVNKIKVYTEYVDDYDLGTQVKKVYENKPISFSPSVIGYSAVGINFLHSMNAELSGKYVSRQYLDNTGTQSRSIDPYFVSDLSVSWSVKPKKIRELTLRFTIYNISNTIYSSGGYSYSGYISGIRNDYNYYFPQAKLNFSGGVVIKI